MSVESLDEAEIDPVCKSNTSDQKSKLVRDLRSSLLGLERHFGLVNRLVGVVMRSGDTRK